MTQWANHGTYHTKKYDNLYTEIKKGLFNELYCGFPEELKNLIDMNWTS